MTSKKALYVNSGATTHCRSLRQKKNKKQKRWLIIRLVTKQANLVVNLQYISMWCCYVQGTFLHIKSNVLGRFQTAKPVSSDSRTQGYWRRKNFYPGANSYEISFYQLENKGTTFFYKKFKKKISNFKILLSVNLFRRPRTGLHSCQ